MAQSEKLDEWLQHRASMAGLSKRTASLVQSSAKAGRDFLWTELATGREFAKLAKETRSSDAQQRRTRAARVAYNTLQRMLSRPKSLPDNELKGFKAELKEFKRDLESLGEKF